MSRTGITDNDAIRELRDEVRDLNRTIKKSNKVMEKYTILLAVIAIIQSAIAYLEFTFSVLTSTHIFVGLMCLLGVVACMWFMFKLGDSAMKGPDTESE